MIETLPEFASIVLSNGGSSPAISASGAAAIAVGLAALASGYAQRGIGAAAVGAVAEDSDNFVSGLIFTAIPETLIIIAFVTIFVA
jgi:V/A-type H+-transporting ATPase subunit K